MPDAQQKTQLNYVAMSFRCALGLTVVETPVGMDPDIPPGRYSLGHTPQTPPRTISLPLHGVGHSPFHHYRPPCAK